MSRPELEQAMVKDFHRILAENAELHVFWHNLPESGRKVVEDRWLEWCWQLVLAHAEPMLGQSARSVGKTFKQFGGFINECKAGNRIEYHGPEWIAMDRRTYDELRARPATTEPERDA